MHMTRLPGFKRSLFAAVSVAGLTISGQAAAQGVPDGATPEATLNIVANHTVPLGPANVLPGVNAPGNGSVYSNSPNVVEPNGSVNGVGQQIAFIQTGPTTAGLSLCSGTLINPRTVITAAHCVYNNPAHRYGSNTGTGPGVSGNFGTGGAPVSSTGIPLSFGFDVPNRNCLNANGLPFTCPAGQKGPYETWRDASFQTQTQRYIYNANQVWYLNHSQPVALGGGGEFANGDIALVTLDTHAQDIPTWTMLFSPLTGATHATITGYGGAGVGLSGIGSLAGIDYRRRSAENMIDGLFTIRQWVSSPAIGGPSNTQFTTFHHPVYFLDFDDPDFTVEGALANPNFFTNTAPPGGRNNGYYDFNGLGGLTLTNEGATAGGDSGGPLIVDQVWEKSVIAGVLTGSLSFNGGISTYGQFNVYPPLFLFWQDIVGNNPYVFASALAGDGDWFDPSHWVQDMDPNYAIIGSGGELVNSLPDTVQGGGDGAVGSFGTVCFLEEDCTTFSGPGNPVGNGNMVFTAGGPGTTNFVPNNVEPVNSATPALNVRARYYDVTLRQAGTTTLGQTATIDVLNIDHNDAKLDIGPAGTLNVWADYTQYQGWTNVDGALNTDEMLVATGLLSGHGTINPDFLTVVAGVVAPGGGDEIGTLTVNSDVILASASGLFVDVHRNAGDLLAVAGVLDLGGGSVVFNKTTDGPAPRHGDTWTIATAALGVNGTFGTVYSFQGVLRPTLTYNANSIVAELRAGSLAQIIDGSNATEVAFASALDQLRNGYYDTLYGLYGVIDLMDRETLSLTLRGLAPAAASESRSLQDRQSRLMLNSITDRLSTLGTGQSGTLSVNGSPVLTAAMATGTTPAGLGFQGLVPSAQSLPALPQGMSGFVSSGYVTGASATGENRLGAAGGQHIAYGSMGLEIEATPRLTVGSAFGYAYGFSAPGLDRAESRTTQVAAYGSYRLGGGFYVAGLAAAEMSRTTTERQVATGDIAFDLYGATESSRYSAMAEAGTNLPVAGGLTLTPRAALAYSLHHLQGFEERGGETALQLDDLRLQRLESRLGARLSGELRMGRWSLQPQLQADMVYTLSGADDGMSVRFASIPDFAFMLPFANGDRSWAEVRGGLTMTNGIVSFGAGVETSIARSGFQDDRAVADLTIRF